MPPSPHLPSARGKAAAAPLRARDQPIKARRSLALIPHRAEQAVSFDYFSLGPQRKVTRAPAGDRKPAAGEPRRGEARKHQKQKAFLPAPPREPNPLTLARGEEQRASEPLSEQLLQLSLIRRELADALGQLVAGHRILVHAPTETRLV